MVAHGTLTLISKADRPGQPPEEILNIKDKAEKARRIKEWKDAQRTEVPKFTQAQMDEALVNSRARYLRNYQGGLASKLANRPPVKVRTKVGIALGLAGAAAAASPWTRSKKPEVRNAPAFSEERTKRGLVGAGIGGGAAYGAYNRGAWALNKFGIPERRAGREGKPTHFQAKEVGQHLKGAGYQRFEDSPAYKEVKHLKDMPGQAGKQYEAAARYHQRTQWGPLSEGYRTMPHHIQGSGISQLTNRIYGPSTFGRKAGTVIATGALVGGAAAHGIPNLRLKAKREKAAQRMAYERGRIARRLERNRAA